MKTKLYLIPGIMCNENLWSKIKPLLENEYELIHLEIPLKSTLDEMVNYLNETIKDEKINLLGFSLGGYIASYFACKYAHRINKLFIMAATACNLPEIEIKKREVFLNVIDALGLKTLNKTKIQSLLEKSNQNNEELISLIGDMYKKLGKEVFKVQMRSTLRRNDLLEEMLKVPVDMKFLYSKEDRLVNQKWIRTFKKDSNNTIFVEFNTNSHMLPLEKPVEVSKEIQQWFN